MRHEELHEVARRQPFQPFRIHLSTGATYDIRHPDLIMVGRRSAVIGIANEPDRMVYDRSFMVDLLHIVGVEELSAAPRSSNGPTA
jgi:hypothetical protein